jgi:hypothetical protein
MQVQEVCSPVEPAPRQLCMLSCMKIDDEVCTTSLASVCLKFDARNRVVGGTGVV